MALISDVVARARLPLNDSDVDEERRYPDDELRAYVGAALGQGDGVHGVGLGRCKK
jgi:hypothetical protein